MSRRKKSNSRSSLVLLLSALLLASPLALASSLPTPPERSVQAITPEELRTHLEFLASDEMGGRFTLAPHLNIAARYLATQLKAYGYRGAASDGSFMQHFDLIATKPVAQRTTLALTVKGLPSSFAYPDFLISNTKGGVAAGPLVFVGYGITSRAQNRDDYQGLNVRNKIVVIAPGAPSGVDAAKLKEEEKGELNAIAHGAVGVIALPPSYRAEDMRKPDFRERAMLRDRVKLAARTKPEVPNISPTPRVADRILSAMGMTLDQLLREADAGRELKPTALNATARMNVALSTTRATTQNVVGILDGSDAQLRNEYVAISAHYDHLRMGPRGEIYHGADDDGSGTVSVLNIARAFSLQKPKRSILVIFHAAEELGLLGSEYNADYAPIVPLERIVTDLNIDMVGRSRPPGDMDQRDRELTDENSVYLVGANKLSAELNEISEQTNSDFERMRIDYLYNNPNHPLQIYFRSDHWNYAKHGIPIIFYTTGLHRDYHQPTDTVDKIDFVKMARIARLVFETGWRVANLDHRLKTVISDE